MSPTRSTKKRVLVIGIDGGTLDVVLPMVEEGKMVNLGTLLDKGSYGVLNSTIPPVTAPAWSSFITGTNPGQHGIYHFFKKENKQGIDNSQKVLANLRQINGIPFWRILNNYGIKVGLINIPLTYPPEPVDGFMISGMLVPKGSNNYTHPDWLLSKLSNYSVDIEGLLEQNKWRVKEIVGKSKSMFIRNVFDISKRRAENAINLIKSEPWDLFMVVFTGSDRICHFFWQDEAEGKSHSAIVEDYYILLDSLIGKIMKVAGNDIHTLIMSDHGFGPAPTKKINIHVLMQKLGGFTFSYLSYLHNRFLTKLKIAERIAPENFIDVKKSKILFERIYANFLGIRITTGIDSEDDRLYLDEEGSRNFRNMIIQRIKALVCPLSKKPLVEEVYTRESLYKGPFANQAPDIIVQFSYDYSLGFSLRNKELVSREKQTFRTGEHRREGLLIAFGDSIASGKLQGQLFIQDITPTILYLLGTPIPTSYDGRVITEIFTPGHTAQNHPQYFDPEGNLASYSNGAYLYSDEESEKLKELLKNLGYL